MNRLNSIRIYWLILLFIIGGLLGACQAGFEETDSFVITFETDPSINYVNNLFEEGEKITVAGLGSIPNGLTGFSLERSINNGAFSPIPLSQINVLSGNLPSPNGVNAFSFVAEIEVVGNVGQNVTLRLAAGSGSENNLASLSYQVAAKGQGGAGGIYPLLYPSYTVLLGGQQSNFKTFLATRTGSSQATYTLAQVSMLTEDEKRSLDISFGVADSQGNAATGIEATVSALISPHNRSLRNFDDAGLGNLAGITSFKLEESISSFAAFEQITSSQVALEVLHNTGAAPYQPIEAGKCYSFINQNGRKGYLWVNQISLAGTQPEEQQVSLVVLVQRS